MEVEPLEDNKILLIIDIREQYSGYVQYLSVEQAARLPEHNS